MTYRCLHDNITFKFIEEVGKGAFQNETDWGFRIVNPAHDVKLPRWAKVEKVGPDVKTVTDGDYILIEPLMWTLGIDFENDKFWSTAEDKILASAKELPAGIV